jgi:prefoldin subunit 5
MTKILSSATYNALKEKADNYDAVVSSIAAKGEGVEAADVTLENIQAVINADEPPVDETAVARITELEGTLETLNSTVTELTTERDALQTKVEALSALPGAESITAVKPAAEASAVETNDLLAFATEHKGDTMAIAEKMREAGYGVK